MTGFLNSLKADLLDRRLLPLVLVVVVALVVAIGYVVLGGGSSSSSTPPTPLPTASAGSSPGVAVSKLSPETAVAETTSGVADQHGGTAHDPFTPLPEPKKKEETTKTAAASTPSSASSESSSSSSESSAPASTPTKPAKPKTIYHVAVLFGAVPPVGTPEAEALTPYENLKLLAPLPSAQQALVVFRGVTSGGKSATFTVVSEAILRGQGKCLPSESQCAAIELKPGQSEQLEYLSSTGQPLLYDLQLVSITSSESSHASAESVLRGESKAGRELLEHEGLTALPGMRFSAERGVLVFNRH